MMRFGYFIQSLELVQKYILLKFFDKHLFVEELVQINVLPPSTSEASKNSTKVSSTKK